MYIYTYVVCTGIAPYASPITSAHCALSFGTLAAVRSTTLKSRPFWGVPLSLGMANGASSAEDSLDNNSKLSLLHTATGHREHSSSQTAAQREERLSAERLQHIPFFITSSYYTCTVATFPYTSFSCIFTLFTYPFCVITHLSNKLLHSWGARHVFAQF